MSRRCASRQPSIGPHMAPSPAAPRNTGTNPSSFRRATERSLPRDGPIQLPEEVRQDCVSKTTRLGLAYITINVKILNKDQNALRSGRALGMEGERDGKSDSSYLGGRFGSASAGSGRQRVGARG